MYPDRETEAAIWVAWRVALEQLQETVDLPTIRLSGLMLLAVEPAKPEHRSAVLQTGPDGGYHLQQWGGRIVSFNDTQAGTGSSTACS